jgi:hypothetical protein
MSLIACMCNQPQRLAEALVPVRASLVAPGPIARWGMGYVHGGEVLLSRTPRSAGTAGRDGHEPLDFFPAIEPIKSDCLIGHAASAMDDSSPSSLPTEATQPFRFRRWMLAQDGATLVEPPVWQALADHVPDFLRRNLRGRAAAELTLHVFMAMLHDQGVLDDPNLPSPVARRALADTLALFASVLTKAGAAWRPGTIAVSNSRALWVARPDVSGAPAHVRRLQVHDDRGHRDDSFRGLLITSALHPGEGAEEVPAGSVVAVSRDLRVDITTLGSV